MKPEYRPCIVTICITPGAECLGETILEGEFKELKSLFHTWTNKGTAIVEYEDGTIHEHYPSEIRFTDGKAKEYRPEENGMEVNHKVHRTIKDNICYFHDRPTLENSTMLWRITSNGYELSADRGNTWESLDDMIYKAIYGNSNSTENE